MPRHINIDWNELFEKHKLIGIIGMLLLFVYLILTAAWEPFKIVFFRGLFLLVSFIKDWTMVFVLIPVYLNWFASDYFQERERTEFRNAITNGILGCWVGVEWIRVSLVVHNAEPNTLLLTGKIIISLVMFAYAILVIKESAGGKSIAHIIGRAREISFLAIMITPIIYNVVPLEWITILAIILLLPMIYGVVEFVEFTILPEPAFLKKQERQGRV